MYTKETGWSGLITDDPKEYADAAVVLHEDQNLWERSRGNGFVILKTLFAKEQSKTRLMEKILFLQQNTVERRLNNFTGSTLMHHTALSTKYMALWIEAKNKLKA
jgi:O-antigen biosynthesis protein